MQTLVSFCGAWPPDATSVAAVGSPVLGSKGDGRGREFKRCTPRTQPVDGYPTTQVRVRLRIIRNARIKNVGKSEACMVYKLRILFKRTVRVSWLTAIEDRNKVSWLMAVRQLSVPLDGQDGQIDLDLSSSATVAMTKDA